MRRLASPPPAEQEELFDVVAERNKRAGWIAAIKAYDRLSLDIQTKLIDRRREIYGPLSEAMQITSKVRTRGNVLEIVRLLLPDLRLSVSAGHGGLIDARPEVREIAGRSSHLAAVSKYRGQSVEEAMRRRRP